MNSVVEDTLNKLKQCDNFHNRCDCLLEHSEIIYLLDYIYEKDRENQILKHRLNDIVFDDANNDVELGARFLRKIGYVDFDEERKVYLNKHNKEPFWEEDEREKDYYILDEELDEYTKQLEYKLQQKENIIKEVREYCSEVIKEHENGDYNVSTTQLAIEEHKKNIQNVLEILDKENKE